MSSDDQATERVFKIKYGNSIRRITYQVCGDWRDWIRKSELRFEKFESRIWGLFDLPSKAQVLITYKDGEDDVITIADTDDMKSLIANHAINPVLVQVTILKSDSSSRSRALCQTLASSSPAAADAPLADAPLKQLMRKLSSNLDDVKKQIQSYEALSESAASESAAEVPGLVENLLQMTIVSSMLTSRLKFP